MGRHLGVLGVAILIAGVIAGCGDDDDGSEATEAASGWTLPNADEQNTRWVSGEIDSSNVTELEEAWSVPITAGGQFGGYSATPVVVDGVAYTQDLESNVFAIDVETGEELWSRKYKDPSVGPNGVNVADGTVYGATSTDAFALDAETGDELWSKKLVRNEFEGIDMAPGYRDGTVYVSTVPGNSEGFYEGEGQAVLHALDAETGDEQWTWDEVPADLWGKSKKETGVNSGGGQWYPPAFDDEGDVYIAVANPAPFPGTEEYPWATSRPGPNKYTNSCVKLDGETGELDWAYQALPHDIYDWDLQSGPILTEADGEPIVLCSGKLGRVFAINGDSGELEWEVPVGKHNGHDDDNELALAGNEDQLPKTPFTLWPGILGGVETQMAVNDEYVFVPVNNLASIVKSPYELTLENPADGTGEMVALDIATGDVAWEKKLPTSAYGAASVVNDLVFTTTFDGTLWAFNTETGDVEWKQQLPAGTNAPVAIDGETVITAGSYPSGAGQQAEIVAYSLSGGGEAGGGGEPSGGGGSEGGGEEAASGAEIFADKCGSCHVLAAADTTGTIGPNLDDVMPSMSAVVSQVTNGGGGMPAFGNSLSEAEIQAVSEYVASSAGKGGGGGGGGGGSASATP